MGLYLARKLSECLKSFNIDNKILGIVCDNAENNSVMVRELPVLLPAFQGGSARIRCFAHILNLVVKVRILFHSCILF
jgi:hypothetical protein